MTVRRRAAQERDQQATGQRAVVRATTARHQVIATAGHVDHGKSALVRALTGMEPDRFAEEQRRGMTIDLGFVWTTLDAPPATSGESDASTSRPRGGWQVAFVDVPGHERFVATMLAGVGPVPAVLLVVAADEGWMPQSTEHLDALDALGVRHGVVAVSRCDLAGPGAATRAVRDRLAGTSLEGSPVVPVSAATGEGLDVLRAALCRMLDGVRPPDDRAPVRLWVDRSFAVTGAGTVVTGTLPAGRVEVGDELEVHSAGRARRVVVRGVQSLGRTRTAMTGVSRVALNLRGVDHDDLRRGDAVTSPGTVTDSALVDVRLRLHGHGRFRDHGAPSADLPGQLLVNLGAEQVTGAPRPLGPDTVRLRLSQPLPLRLGDRLLLRDPGRHLVLGSAVVLDASPQPLRRRGDARRRGLLLQAVADRPDAVSELRRRGLATPASLRAAGFARHEVDQLLALRCGAWLLDPAHASELGKRLRRSVTAHLRANPLEPGLPLERARQELGLPDVRLVQTVVRDGATAEAGSALVVVDGRVTLAVGDAHRLPDDVAAAVEALRTDLVESPFVAPDAARLAALRLDRRSLAAAVRTGHLARVADGVYLLPDWLERARETLGALAEPFSVSDARTALGTSRRVAVPLLERLDAEGVTRRLPDDRRVVER